MTTVCARVCVYVSYWQANMKSGRHPAQNGWIHVLWPVCGSHHHHLQSLESQCEYIMPSKPPIALTLQTQDRHHVEQERYPACNVGLDLVKFKRLQNKQYWVGFLVIRKVGLNLGCT